MTTLAEVRTQPASGLLHIDGLLASGPGWNWLTPARTTLFYTFTLGPLNENHALALLGPPTPFNALQQAASTTLLGEISALTGIQFSLTIDPVNADLHFAAGNVAQANVAGFVDWRSNSTSREDAIVNYDVEAWVFIDNAEVGSITNAPTINTEFGLITIAPTILGEGDEVLLHELGHVLGLKHPFEGAVQLPAAQNNTANTLMSYTHVGGPYDSYSGYDIAALMWLYGGDGLGGALGQGSPGSYLVGTTGVDHLIGGNGSDRFEGMTGNDIIDGGTAVDWAIYPGLRASHQVSVGETVVMVRGGQGVDTLRQVERLQFADQSLAFDFDGAAGTTALFLGAIFGAASVANQHYAGIGIGLLDGGLSTSAFMQLALDARLGVGFSRSAEIDLLFRNLTGAAPTAGEMTFWLGEMESQQFTPVSLALAAADLPLNASNIDLVGLTQTGLAFTG